MAPAGLPAYSPAPLGPEYFVMKTPNGRVKGNRSRGAVSRADLETIKGDLATLKRDLVALFAHLEASAVTGAGGAALKAVGQMGGETVRFCDRIAAEAQDRSRELRLRVERQPLSSVLTACALGMVVARMSASHGNDRQPRRRR